MTQAPPLATLYAYLTQGCNLACGHCWLAAGRGGGGAGRTLPAQTLAGAIREARPLGLKGVKLTGGEPLLHPRIDEILELVAGAGLELVLETNGVLCTPELAARIALVSERSVSVSLDGADAATHDAARGVRGAFDGAVRGVQALAAAGTPPQIVMTVLRANMAQLADLVSLAERIGASSVKFNLVQPSGGGARLHAQGAVPGVAEILALGGLVEQDLALRTPLPLAFDVPQAFRSLRRLAAEDGGDSCRILSVLGLLPGGEYALCGVGELAPQLVFGRAGVDGLDRVWREAPLLLELREGLPTRLEGVCRRCLMRESCLGSCLAQNFLAGGSLWGPYWFCAAAERQALFPLSRLASDRRR